MGGEKGVWTGLWYGRGLEVGLQYVYRDRHLGSMPWYGHLFRKPLCVCLELMEGDGLGEDKPGSLVGNNSVCW